MRAGLVVEEGPVPQVIAHPGHPYTIELIDSFPNPDRRGMRLSAGAA
jgi:ABC-type dipeptide/oligopeptide/nickel transport system ATPase component